MPKWKLSFCFVPILALALAGRAEASCESQYRVSEDDSECLESSHSNSRWHAFNACWNHTIRVKVDIKNANDVTKDVAARNRASGTVDTSWGRRVRGVYCCSDYSSCNE